MLFRGIKRTEEDLARARGEFRNALEIYNLIGDQYGRARALYRLGDVFAEERKYQDAAKKYL